MVGSRFMRTGCLAERLLFGWLLYGCAAAPPIPPSRGEGGATEEVIYVPAPKLGTRQYNSRDVPAADLSDAETELVAIVDYAASRTRLDSLPTLDPRLSRAARVMVLGTRGMRPPPTQLVFFALARAGIVETDLVHTVGRVETRHRETAESEAQIESLVQKTLETSPFTRYGVASREELGFLTVFLVVFQRQILETAPIDNRLALGETAIVRARLRRPFTEPTVYIERTTGRVESLGVQVSEDGAFSLAYGCGNEPGRIRVEVMATGHFGPSIAANFPVWCGVEPEKALRMLVPPWRDRFPNSTEAAERQLFKLINDLRVNLLLAPVTHNQKTAEVARAHSVDMRDNRFFGHRSPSTGYHFDRLQAAGLAYRGSAENIARGSSALESHYGLEQSPGHRMGMLQPHATQVGVGVALGESNNGIPQLLVTEIFIADRTHGVAPRKPVKPDEAVESSRKKHSGIRFVTDDIATQGCTIVGMHSASVVKSTEIERRKAKAEFKRAAKEQGADTVFVEEKTRGHRRKLMGTLYDCTP